MQVACLSKHLPLNLCTLSFIHWLWHRFPRLQCQHLNGSRLLAASFDGHRPFRGYGINTRGELLSLVTPHEGRITSCKVGNGSAAE